eukprot:1945709-Pleurochrysis_carterae.AAC.1
MKEGQERRAPNVQHQGMCKVRSVFTLELKICALSASEQCRHTGGQLAAKPRVRSSGHGGICPAGRGVRHLHFRIRAEIFDDAAVSRRMA